MQVGLKTSEICKYFSLQASHGCSINTSVQQRYLYAVYTTKLLVCCLHNRSAFMLSIQHRYFDAIYTTRVLLCYLYNTGTFIQRYLYAVCTTRVLLYCLHKLQHRYFYTVYTTQVFLFFYVLSCSVYNTDTFMPFEQQMYFYAVCTTDVVLSVQQRYI